MRFALNLKRTLPLPLLALLVAAILTGAAGGSAPVDLNSAEAKEIAELPGVTPELAKAVIAFREEHGPFDEPKEILEVPGMTVEVWEAIRARVRALPPLSSDPAGAEPQANGGIIAIANYFIEFEGLDLTVLTDEGRQAFLDTVNGETCDCGCDGDTMARCYVNDPGCEVARKRVKSVYDHVIKHASKPPPATKAP